MSIGQFLIINPRSLYSVPAVGTPGRESTRRAKHQIVVESAVSLPIQFPRCRVLVGRRTSLCAAEASHAYGNAMIRTFRRFNVAVRPASSRCAYQISTEQDHDNTSGIAGFSQETSGVTQFRWFQSSNHTLDSQANPDPNPTSTIGAVKQRRGEAVKTLSVTGKRSVC